MGVEFTEVLAFCLVILVANTIQGITGFAGTLIAMPFLIILVDLETAKQVLNLLGIIGSFWILRKDHCFIRWNILKQIIVWMLIGMIIGIIGYNYLPTGVLMYLFPLFVLFVGLKGFLSTVTSALPKSSTANKWSDILLLLVSGTIHGLFVAGGPLLVAYATREIKNKQEFRATLSAVWVVLNTLMLIQSLFAGVVTEQMAIYMLISIIPLIFGIVIGGILLNKMSQKSFMVLAYGLLIFSGISLLV